MIIQNIKATSYGVAFFCNLFFGSIVLEVNICTSVVKKIKT